MRTHDNRRRLRPWPLMPCATAAALALAAGPALAQDTRLGPYLGATVGKPDWNANSVGGISGDSSSTGLKLYGGWRAHPNFSAELSAMRLGRLAGPLGSAKADGYALDALGLLPLTNQWSAFARAGLAQVKTRVPGASDRETVPKFGAGAQVLLGAGWALRGEWERYRLDAFGSKSNADLYSLGAHVAF